jgi:hypothetical protein
MNKNLIGGEAMERKEQMQSQTKKGGVAMRRYLWSTIDASGRLVPYVVLECSEETAREIESRDRYENEWMFIADRLHERYSEQFPEWWDGYGRRNAFWYNNVLEDYEEAYERIAEERMKELRDCFDDEECLKHEAEWQVEEELARLPVFVIENEQGGENMEQELQAQAQLGGETQQAYYPDDRGLWWSSRLGDVALYVYDYEEAKGLGVDCLAEPTPFIRIYEKCDCMERFNTIRHNDGGWYHRIIRLFRITPEIFIASYEDSRDVFYASELRYAVVLVNGERVGKVVLKEGEWCELLRKDEAEKLIRAYGEDEDYTVYYTDRE